jgi:hypothetical protein
MRGWRQWGQDARAATDARAGPMLACCCLTPFAVAPVSWLLSWRTSSLKSDESSSAATAGSFVRSGLRIARAMQSVPPSAERLLSAWHCASGLGGVPDRPANCVGFAGAASHSTPRQRTRLDLAARRLSLRGRCLVYNARVIAPSTLRGLSIGLRRVSAERAAPSRRRRVPSEVLKAPTKLFKRAGNMQVFLLGHVQHASARFGHLLSGLENVLRLDAPELIPRCDEACEHADVTRRLLQPGSAPSGRRETTPARYRCSRCLETFCWDKPARRSAAAASRSPLSVLDETQTRRLAKDLEPLGHPKHQRLGDHPPSPWRRGLASAIAWRAVIATGSALSGGLELTSRNTSLSLPRVTRW